MAVATSSESSSYKSKMNFHPNLVKYISLAVCGDDPLVKLGKPEPDVFLETAKRMGIEPSSILVFEDSPFGCQGAKSAGCYVCSIPDNRFPENLEKFNNICDFKVNNLEEFLNKYLKAPLTKSRL